MIKQSVLHIKTREFCIFARGTEELLLPIKPTGVDSSISLKTLPRQRARKSAFGSEQARNIRGERTKEEAAGST